jgi:hypothetical protein
MRALEGTGSGLFDGADFCIARLSHQGEAEWAGRLAVVRDVQVLALVCRSADQDAEQARPERYQVSDWEIPLVEIAFVHDATC